MECQTVTAFLIDSRSKAAVQVREALMRSGCFIDSRLGQREDRTARSEQGCLVPHLCGSLEDVEVQGKGLSAIPGVRPTSTQPGI